MQLHNLKKNKANKEGQRVGRGGKRGKTSGRGTKGQNARSGRKKRPEMRDFIKRLPKLRGRGKNSLKSRFAEAKVIDFSLIEGVFKSGETINPESLSQKGLVKMRNGRLPMIKILGSGKISKVFNFEKLIFSNNLKVLVEKAGGTIK